MSVVFLHTADWQLGKPFASLKDEGKRHRLQDERVEAVRRLRGICEEMGAAFVLVAGDVFDSSNATKATVSAACKAIGALRAPVLVIPGNHDHGGPGSIWEQDFFRREREELAPNLMVLLERRPVPVGGAVVLPAPLLRRHETDPTGWIQPALAEQALPEGLPRVVLAHGTVQGFGGGLQEDEDEGAGAVNWINLARLPEAEVDYMALGDWHGTKQVGAKAWYSGTPEADRFPRGEGNEPGHVLKVTVARGMMPVVERVATGRLRWTEMHFRFAEDAGLELFARRMAESVGEQAEECLLWLKLSGSLGIEAAARLEEMLESWEARLLRLKLQQEMAVAPSAEEVLALAGELSNPLVASVARRLVEEMNLAGEAGRVARLALRELHAACFGTGRRA